MSFAYQRKTDPGYGSSKEQQLPLHLQALNKQLSPALANACGENATNFDAPAVALIKWLLFPVLIVASLIGCVLFYGQNFEEDFLALAIVSFLLAAHIFDEAKLFRHQSKFPLSAAISDIALKWVLMVVCLWILAIATNMTGQFPYRPILAWVAVTPLALLAFHWLCRPLLRSMVANSSHRKAVIVGANQLGWELLKKIVDDDYLGVNVIGFFDDRVSTWDSHSEHEKYIGRVNEVADYVREHNINLVFICLPMLAQPRMVNLLDGLRDSSAAVCFVPNIFLFDLFNAHFDRISDVPILSIRDTPYLGVLSLVKRFTDIIIASVLLLLTFPVLIFIALGIKFSSPGPVLFQQRRQGLVGEAFKVFKFRTMTVTEDGDCIVQAKKDDQRVTRFGKFLRKTSLDELPQLLNVLQGSMSMVGPRPHAIAHNEMYRKLISGYMIRNTVKPGITGWAQVNGLRGETDTPEKMAERVRYDLEYLKHWSPMLDLWIILKTVKVVFVADKNAF